MPAIAVRFSRDCPRNADVRPPLVDRGCLAAYLAGLGREDVVSSGAAP